MQMSNLITSLIIYSTVIFSISENVVNVVGIFHQLENYIRKL